VKQIITAKLKLNPTSHQHALLRKTSLAYRDALNFASWYAFEHNKLSNQQAIQRGTYQDMRQKFKLGAQMACSVCRQVGATYKGLWTKVKQNAALRKAGVTIKRYKGLDKAAKFVNPTLTYQLGHDYGFKTNQCLSLLTLAGRVEMGYEGYHKHLELIRGGSTIGGAKLWYNKPKKQFYLLVSLEIEVIEPTPETHKQVVGVDVGLRYLAVTTDTRDHTQFFSGKAVRHQANHLARLRNKLQRKGTRAAKRKLVTISGRERRLKLDANHCISKKIVSSFPASIIGLEELTNIRQRTKRHSGKKASSKQRRSNRITSKWSFAELQGLISYKAALVGSLAIKVEASYTSQSCPKCGYTSRDNRPQKGLLFVCQVCQHSLHADLVGARNISLRTLLIRQDWVNTGLLSVAPKVSDGEAKAALLQKYAELRWSPVTSPRL
jgi:IS605 OrfB family transposase